MCGRYEVSAISYKWAEKEIVYDYEEPLDYPAIEMTPGKTIEIIMAGEKRPKLAKALWGFKGKDSSLLINARSESIEAKASFEASFNARRCLVPASAFFEWDQGRNKVKFKVPGKEVFYLGCIWTMEDDELRFVILTTEANDSMAPVHDRMPIIIDKEDAMLWLYDKEGAKRLLAMEMPKLLVIRDEQQLSFL